MCDAGLKLSADNEILLELKTRASELEVGRPFSLFNATHPLPLENKGR